MSACLIVCDLETSTMRRPKHDVASSARKTIFVRSPKPVIVVKMFA